MISTIISQFDLIGPRGSTKATEAVNLPRTRSSMISCGLKDDPRANRISAAMLNLQSICPSLSIYFPVKEILPFSKTVLLVGTYLERSSEL